MCADEDRGKGGLCVSKCNCGGKGFDNGGKSGLQEDCAEIQGTTRGGFEAYQFHTVSKIFDKFELLIKILEEVILI